jgi:NitT/TauT family transport system substrate-binding protein
MTNRWSRFVLLLVVVALAAAACGDDSSATTTTTTATPTTEDAASTTAAGEGALETTTMTAGALPLVDFAPLFYAEAMGYFEEVGLDVTVEVVQSGPVAAQLLLAGDLDASFINWLSFAAAVSNDAPLVVVANGTHLADGQGGVFVTADSPLASLADLDGRSVATNSIGNVGDVTIEALIADEGLDVEVDYVEVAFPEIIPAIESGSVDAGFLTEPFTTFAKVSGLRSIADPYTGSAKNLPIAGYMSTAQYAAENPNTIAAFRRAIEAATADLLDDEEALRAFIPVYSAVSEEAAQALILPLYQTTLTVEDIQRPADLMFDLGYLDEPLDMNLSVING